MRKFSDSENLNLSRWQELEHENPHYLAKLLEQRSEEVMPEIYQEALKNGIPISYRDPHYNNEIIQEYPDGKRFVLKVYFDSETKKFVKELGQEISKRVK